MFFWLSKILFYLAMPLTWILLALLVALFTKSEKRRKRGLLLSTVLLLFFTNPFFCNEAWLLWERPPVPFQQVGRYDAAIILTGFTNQKKSPHDRAYTGHGADRMLHTLRLYKEGKAGRIVISGGSGSLLQAYSSEAAEIRQFLLQSAVPAAHILFEDKSRNTHENARQTKQLLLQQPQLKKLLLVTSAFHMRRAAACFQKEGIAVATFPADYYSTDRGWTPDQWLIPREENLYKWQKLLHELLGFVVYKAIGYC